MKARSWLAATVLAGLLTPGAYGAEGLKGRFSIVFQGGTQSEVAGDLIHATTGALFDKTLTIDSKRYRDVYAPDLRLQGLVGYGLAPKLELIARGTWYKADATPSLEVGTLDDKKVYAIFDEYADYEEVGAELALRYYIAAAARLKSYVAPVVGARWLAATYLSLAVVDDEGYTRYAIQNVPFQKKGTVPVYGLDIGFSFDFGEHFFVGMDTGIRYQSAPPPANALPGLEQFDDSEGKWSAPVVLSVGARF
jgi:hypothetical protein